MPSRTLIGFELSFRRFLQICLVFPKRPPSDLLLLIRNLDDRRLPRAHDGVLARHPPAEGAIELGTQGQLGKVALLFVVEDHALAGELRVLQPLEPVDDRPDLGCHAVGAEDGRCDGGRHAERAVSDGVTGLERRRK